MKSKIIFQETKKQERQKNSERKNYIIVDVETPSKKCDGICQIGIVKHEEINDRTIVNEYKYLVNPEKRFDEFCMNLHGITKNDVKDAPIFIELWERELKDLFSDSILVAHNAKFDVGVLEKTLAHYGADLPPSPTLCTVKLSRKAYPYLSSHRLNVVAEHIGFDFEKHHDALCDAQAAYAILLDVKNKSEELIENCIEP